MRHSRAKCPLTIIVVIAMVWLLLSTPAQAFRFAFLADSRQYYATPAFNQTVLEEILTQINNQSPQPLFVVFGGDMAADGGTNNLQPWKDFFEQKLNIAGTPGKPKFYVAKGNHEVHGDPCVTRYQLEEDFLKVFAYETEGGSKSYYSFTRGESATSLFVVLDTFRLPPPDPNKPAWPIDLGHVNQEQLKWLESTLTVPSYVKHIFVFGHAPVDPKYKGDEHGVDSTISDKLAEILIKKNVDLYLAGHDHLYDKRNLKNSEVVQLIVGNAGAEPTKDPYNYAIVDVSADSYTFTVYGKDQKSKAWKVLEQKMVKHRMH